MVERLEQVNDTVSTVLYLYCSNVVYMIQLNLNFTHGYMHKFYLSESTMCCVSSLLHADLLWTLVQKMLMTN